VNGFQPVDWHLVRDGQQFGPITEREFARLVTDRQVRPNDLLWRPGWTDWVPAVQVRGLFPTEPPPIPPQPVFPEPSAPYVPAPYPPVMTASETLGLAGPHPHSAGATSDHHSPAPAARPKAKPLAKSSRPATADTTPTGLAIATYVLLLLPFPPLPLIGFIIALVNRGAKPDWLASHYRYQVNTFLLYVVFLLSGLLLLFVSIGAIILVVGVIWNIYRLAKGISRLNSREPMGAVA
jgi:uncharacterized membrane protein